MCPALVQLRRWTHWTHGIQTVYAASLTTLCGQLAALTHKMEHKGRGEEEREQEKQLFQSPSPVNRVVLPTEDTCLPKASFLHSQSCRGVAMEETGPIFGLQG